MIPCAIRAMAIWKPENPVKHALPEARWPTAEEAARARLFSPIRLGPVEAAERTWVPAMVPWRATEDGFVTPEVTGWYARFAEGEPGVLVAEATGIRDVPSGPLLRVGDDRFIPGLARLCDEVRRRSASRTRFFLQAIDFLAVRRRPEPRKFFERFLAVTDEHRERLVVHFHDESWFTASEAEVRSALAGLPDAKLDGVLAPRELESLRFGYRERVTDVHLPHVRDLPKALPDLFAAAAARAERAGFDGIELHFAHAYTMASFLSAKNDRADGYGGSREGRVRLPLEVLAAVRARVSPRFAVGCRFLGDEIIEGGTRVEDAAWFGARFAEAGMDFLSVSTGGKFDDAAQPHVGEAVYPYTGRSGYECMPTVVSDARGPFGRNVHLAAAIRRAVRLAGRETPVVAAGGIATFEQAEGILARGEADAIASARQSLADPDWWRKMRLGRGAEVRRCIFTNYCEGLDQKHKQVTCQLWDRLALDEPGVALASDGKRRLTPPEWRP
jgi:2,4-dienoyl-CoA reductase-like NADH-dependent reductase (Old Yellow Enzyme family)